MTAIEKKHLKSLPTDIIQIGVIKKGGVEMFLEK